MMYQTLAHYYDALVKDDEATKAWVSLIEQYIPRARLMEVACGSGEITIALAKDGYQIHASDLSSEMIQEAQKKAGSEAVTWSVMDMCEFQDTLQYNGILCLCDSFNYLLKLEQVKKFFQQVYDHLEQDGIFLMDMHSLDRLAEFHEEFIEAGNMLGHAYQWSIYSEEDRIYQNFAFYDDDGVVTLEQHIQRVYDPQSVEQMLTACGFVVQIITDFDQEGICPGEKQFFIAKKVAL